MPGHLDVWAVPVRLLLLLPLLYISRLFETETGSWEDAVRSLSISNHVNSLSIQLTLLCRLPSQN